MNLKQYFLTENDCYKAGQKITVKGIMIHSTGANNPCLNRYIAPDDGLLGQNLYGNHWNQAKPGGIEVCAHAFIGKLKNGSVATYQTLPWNQKGWHAGGKANDSHIGVEICEDGMMDSDYFNKIYTEALELCVYLCKMYGLTEKDILGHYEGFMKRIASNHADPKHWFAIQGTSMDAFRSDVSKRLSAVNATDTKKVYRVQVGAFSDKANAETMLSRLKAAGYTEAYIKSE